MKTFVLPFLLLVFISASAQKKKIQPSQLPDGALGFLEKNIKNAALHHSYQFTDDGATRYKVVMADDTEIEFDDNGNWTEVDGGNHSIPSGFLPETIIASLTKNYPGKRLLKVEKETRKYEVKLVDGTEIDYDLNGNMLKK